MARLLDQLLSQLRHGKLHAFIVIKKSEAVASLFCLGENGIIQMSL